MAHMLEVVDGVASFACAESVKGKVWWLSPSLQASRVFEGSRFGVSAGVQAARAGFKVAALPTFLADGREAPCKAVVRQDTNAILSGVGGGWTPVQNEDAIRDALAPFYKDSEIALQTIGVLDGGRTVFAQTPPIATIEITPTKRWEARVTVSNSHYSRRIDALLTGIDVVCANTLGAAFLGAQEDGTIERVRHTSGVRSSLKNAAKRLASEMDKLNALAEGARVALDTPMTLDEQVEVVRQLWDATGKDGQPTRQAEEAQARVLKLSSGEGLIGAEEHNPGSAYGLYAAITQWIDRELTRRYSEEEKQNKALANATTYLRSALNLDPRAAKIRSKATQILLGVGSE